MLGQYKKILIGLVDQIRYQQAHQEDLNHLLSVQRSLITLISDTERRIGGSKRRLQELKRLLRSRPSKEVSRRLKLRIDHTHAVLRRNFYLLFIWRCFGDALAFSYVDKYALKHLFYKTATYDVKEEPGQMSGKLGLVHEWALIERAREAGVPAILCDLTNTIRHGDVCLLGESDPFPIEVKSGSGRNARAGRQIESVRTLLDFFKTDNATNFRGLPSVARVAFTEPEVNHFAAIARCIGNSKRTGYAFTDPEPGLRYLCVRNAASARDASDALAGPYIVVSLNEPKMTHSWMPYYPFVLSLREADTAYEFMDGSVSILVGLHVPTMVQLFDQQGMAATLVDHPDYAMTVQNKGGVWGIDPSGAISRHLFVRVFLEFQSLAWFVRRERQQLDHLAEHFDDPRTDDLQSPTGIPEFQPLRWS